MTSTCVFCRAIKVPSTISYSTVEYGICICHQLCEAVLVPTSVSEPQVSDFHLTKKGVFAPATFCQRKITLTFCLNTGSGKTLVLNLGRYRKQTRHNPFSTKLPLLFLQPWTTLTRRIEHLIASKQLSISSLVSYNLRCTLLFVDIMIQHSHLMIQILRMQRPQRSFCYLLQMHRLSSIIAALKDMMSKCKMV